MGLFARDITCPHCNDPGARKALFGGVRCPNRACPFFDVGLMNEREAARLSPRGEGAAAAPAGSVRRYRNPRTGARIERGAAHTGAFEPGPFRIEVRYENFRGEPRTFIGDRRTLLRRGNHLSLQVMPTGIRIALSRDRIQNLAEVESVESAMGPQPTGQERRVLLYHAKRGTTSELCERLRQKYPEWSAPPGP